MLLQIHIGPVLDKGSVVCVLGWEVNLRSVCSTHIYPNTCIITIMMIAVTCSILFTNLRLSSGFSYEQAPYSYVLVQVVLVWKGHFQILSTDLSGPRISLLSMCSIACASSYDLHCVFNKFNRKNICKTFNIQHALTAKMA